jgi:hypothetical protein
MKHTKDRMHTVSLLLCDQEALFSTTYVPRNWISKRYPLAALLGTRGCSEEGSQRISLGLTNVQLRDNPKRSHDHFGPPFGHRHRARPGYRRRLIWLPPWPLDLTAAVAT